METIDIDKFHRALASHDVVLLESEFLDYLVHVHDAMYMQEKIDLDNKITVSIDEDDLTLTEHGSFCANDFSGYESDINPHYIPMHVLGSDNPIWAAKDHMLSVRATVAELNILRLEDKLFGINKEIETEKLKLFNIQDSIKHHSQKKPS